MQAKNSRSLSTLRDKKKDDVSPYKKKKEKKDSKSKDKDNKNKSISLTKSKSDLTSSNSFNSNVGNNNIEIRINQTNSLSELQSYISSSETTLILLIKKEIKNKDCLNSQTVTPYYDLYFLPGIALDLLRRFSYLDTKVIGLKEYKYYFSDSDTMFFPDDYPSTKAYRNYLTQKTEERLERYYLLPPSKRVNYQRIGNPFPFCPSWDCIFNTNINTSLEGIEKSLEKPSQFNLLINPNNKSLVMQQVNWTAKHTNLELIEKEANNRYLVGIQVETIHGGGIPEFNSLICLPLESDIRNYLKNGKVNKPNLLIESLNVSLTNQMK